MSKALYTPLAKQDLQDIGLFIGEKSLQASEELLELFSETCQALSLSPKIGRKREELASKLRSFPVGNYIIFYRFFKDEIHVIRVLHAARDIHSLFIYE